MKYRLLFNKLNIETFSEFKNLVHIIDSILMSAHKINNIKYFVKNVCRKVYKVL